MRHFQAVVTNLSVVGKLVCAHFRELDLCVCLSGDHTIKPNTISNLNALGGHIQDDLDCSIWD